LDYIRVGNDVFRKINNYRYLQLSKDKKLNSISIQTSIDGKFKKFGFTPNSKHLICEKIEEE
jgi:hypothetical protein